MSRTRSPNRRQCLALLAGSIAAPALASTPGSRNAVLVGQSAPLSGMMAPGMAGVLEGQQAAFEDANRRGGFGGRPVQLEMLDDGFDPKRTLDNARTLVEQRGVVALFGTVGTAQTAAVLPYVAQQRVPLIAAYSGSPALRTQANPYFFTTQASYADELVKMVRNLRAVHASRIAVVYQNNEFGKLLLPLAEKVIQDEGASVAGTRALEVAGADAVAAAQATAAMRPSAVIMIAAGPAVVSYVKANRAYVGVPVYTFSLSVGATTLKALGDEARGLAVSRATPYPWRATTPLAREFTQSMERNRMVVDYDHFAGYINARVVCAALKGCGRGISPQAVTESMERLERLDLGGYQLSFSPNNRHGSNFVEITVVGPNGNFIR